MADDDTTNTPYVNPYASPYAAPLTVGDPAIAERFAGQHRAEIERRQKQVDDMQAAQDMNVEKMQKALDATATKLRENRSGRGNLPLMTFGANMMGPGDFGTQLGRGFKAMVPAIQQQRQDEDTFETKMGGLEVEKLKLANAPLADRLKYIQALQVGDINALRAIEQAQIRSGGNQQTAEQKANKQRIDEEKNKAAVLAKASAEAQKQFAELSKENDYTEVEAQNKYKELLRQQITLQAGGAGMQLNEEFVTKALNSPTSTLGTDRNLFPDLGKQEEEGLKSGLPERPSTYNDMGSKDRAKERAKQADVYRTEAKGWDEAAGLDKTNDDRLREAEMIIRQRPDLLGLIAGRGWNVTPEATRLATILKQLETSNVPKGQGQITDFERKLFAEAGVMMTNNPQAALQTIARMRESNNRSAEQREFFDKYFQTYKTMDGARAKWETYMRSPAASYTIEKDGKLVGNEDRMPYNVYFKWQRAGSPEIRRGPDGQWLIRRDGKVEVLQ